MFASHLSILAYVTRDVVKAVTEGKTPQSGVSGIRLVTPPLVSGAGLPETQFQINDFFDPPPGSKVWSRRDVAESGLIRQEDGDCVLVLGFWWDRTCSERMFPIPPGSDFPVSRGRLVDPVYAPCYEAIAELMMIDRGVPGQTGGVFSVYWKSVAYVLPYTARQHMDVVVCWFNETRDLYRVHLLPGGSKLVSADGRSGRCRSITVMTPDGRTYTGFEEISSLIPGEE